MVHKMLPIILMSPYIARHCVSMKSLTVLNHTIQIYKMQVNYLANFNLAVEIFMQYLQLTVFCFYHILYQMSNSDEPCSSFGHSQKLKPESRSSLDLLKDVDPEPSKNGACPLGPGIGSRTHHYKNKSIIYNIKRVLANNIFIIIQIVSVL